MVAEGIKNWKQDLGKKLPSAILARKKEEPMDFHVDQPVALVDCQSPMLEQVSRALTQEELQDPSLQKLCDAMLSFAKGEQGDRQRSVLVGLAAPQVGKHLRIVLVDVKADGCGNVSELRVYINPEIVESSEEESIWYEGCYSTGKVKGIVARPEWIRIRAFDRHGHSIEEVHSGYVARIFQHEIDHLDGVRFPEHIPADGVIHLVEDEEMGFYRSQQRWREWQRTAPQPEWKRHM